MCRGASHLDASNLDGFEQGGKRRLTKVGCIQVTEGQRLFVNHPLSVREYAEPDDRFRICSGGGVQLSAFSTDVCLDGCRAVRRYAPLAGLG